MATPTPKAPGTKDKLLPIIHDFSVNFDVTPDAWKDQTPTVIGAVIAALIRECPLDEVRALRTKLIVCAKIPNDTEPLVIERRGEHLKEVVRGVLKRAEERAVPLRDVRVHYQDGIVQKVEQTPARNVDAVDFDSAYPKLSTVKAVHDACASERRPVSCSDWNALLTSVIHYSSPIGFSSDAIKREIARYWLTGSTKPAVTFSCSCSAPPSDGVEHPDHCEAVIASRAVVEARTGRTSGRKENGFAVRVERLGEAHRVQLLLDGLTYGVLNIPKGGGCRWQSSPMDPVVLTLPDCSGVRLDVDITVTPPGYSLQHPMRELGSESDDDYRKRCLLWVNTKSDRTDSENEVLRSRLHHAGGPELDLLARYYAIPLKRYGI